MPNNTKNAGVKMSLGAFMGGSPANEMAALPTRPRERGPEDDGSFRRTNRRDEQDNYQPSRGDADDNWRRGGSSSREDRGGGGYERRGGGGFDDRGYDRRGGGGYGDRGGMDRGGGDRSNWRGGGGYNNNSSRDGGRFERRGGYDDDRGFDRKQASGPQSNTSFGSRPRLQLKARTAPASQDKNEEKSGKTNEDLTSEEAPSTKDTSTSGSSPLTQESHVEVTNENEVDHPQKSEVSNEEPSGGEKKKREPEIVNSRAAAMGSAPSVHRDSNGNAMHRENDRRERNRGPPPVVNKRFESLADSERDNNRDSDFRRGPPPIANSRFAAAAEADRSNRDNVVRRDDRGPPPVANSRFAAAAEADRGFNTNRDDRGPPPVANSRFAAAAEADRDYRRDRDDRGPPPIANSRFAAAAEADRDYRNDGDMGRREDRGPPPVANSRFAAAAAMAEQEGGYREDRESKFGRNDGPRGPPIPQNSRFAAAAAADPDYMERGDRERAEREREERGRRGGGYGGRDGFDGRGRGDYDDDRGFGGDRFEDLPRHPAPQDVKSSVADLLKPKARPMEENILKVPTKGQQDNILKLPSKDQADNVLNAPINDNKSGPTDPKENTDTAVKPSSSDSVSVDDEALVEKFVSGGKQGEDLKGWVAALDFVPSVEKIVFHLLTEKEKLNPDVECSWAEPDKYGSALVSLVEDDLLKQVDVLFGIQKYCNKLGMPKLNDEYVVQAMFRAMYKYDLAGDEAFMMWKDDESPQHEAGKLNAVIQTVDWFNWLEEDDDDEEEDEE